MPKIAKWSRTDKRGPHLSKAAWEHDDTGEVLYISHKPPNNGGYTVMAAEAKAKPLGTGDGERVGYHHTLRGAKHVARENLRDNPDGFKSDDHE